LTRYKTIAINHCVDTYTPHVSHFIIFTDLSSQIEIKFIAHVYDA